MNQLKLECLRLATGISNNEVLRNQLYYNMNVVDIAKSLEDYLSEEKTSSSNLGGSIDWGKLYPDNPGQHNENKIIKTDIKELATDIHKNAVEKGFWDETKEIGTLLMLCVSELSEAIEADRKDKYANLYAFENKTSDEQVIDETLYKRRKYENYIKDTFESELAGAVIRILDIAAAKKIDIAKYINYEMKYNKTRSKKHNKKY